MRLRRRYFVLLGCALGAAAIHYWSFGGDRGASSPSSVAFDAERSIPNASGIRFIKSFGERRLYDAIADEAVVGFMESEIELRRYQIRHYRPEGRFVDLFGARARLDRISGAFEASDGVYIKDSLGRSFFTDAARGSTEKIFGDGEVLIAGVDFTLTGVGFELSAPDERFELRSDVVMLFNRDRAERP